jgi:hypothetical protein
VFCCAHIFATCCSYKLANMGRTYKLTSFSDRVPYSCSSGALQQLYWPPDMQQRRPHLANYDTYCLGLMLAEARTAQLPFVHLWHLPWKQQRLRRTFAELVACGSCSQLLPREMGILRKCLEAECTQRLTGVELQTAAEYRYIEGLPEPKVSLECGCGIFLRDAWCRCKSRCCMLLACVLRQYSGQLVLW